MKTKQSILLLLLCSFIFSWVAFFNGYALTDGDTGTYLNNAMSYTVHPDRPPFYGVFIRFSSFRTSLWFTVFVQAFILSFLLLKYIELLLKEKPVFNFALIIFIAIGSFTCVSWVVSFLMPDIFTCISMLAIILFLLRKPNEKYYGALYFTIALISILTHSSHLLIDALFALFIIIYGFVKRNRVFLIRGVALMVLPLVFWVTMCFVNNSQGWGFTFSKSTHAFFFSRLVEMGLVRKYLDDNCGAHPVRLCQYKNELSPYSWMYLWSEKSPMRLNGGWDSCKTENEHIIRGILSFPLLTKFIQKSILGTLRQLTMINVQEKFIQNDVKYSTPYWHIENFVLDESGEYSISRQCTGGVDTTRESIIYNLIFLISVIWILFHFPAIDTEQRFIYFLVFTFLVINAFVTSTFSTILSRYQYRVFWVFPATNLILICSYYWNKIYEKLD